MNHAQGTIEERPLARKRPGVVLLAYAFRLVAAFVLAWPFAVTLGGAVSGYPRGDAVLFDQGGMLLLEALRRSAGALRPATSSSLLLFVLVCFLSLLPLAALLGALGAKGRITARDLGAWALRPIGTFSLLLGAAAIVEAILGGIAIGIGNAVARRETIDLRAADQIRVGFVAGALLLVLFVSVFHDLARVATVRGELGFRASIKRAFAAFRSAPLSLLAGWSWRAALGAVLLGAALVVASRLGVERKSQVVAGFLVHQASVLAVFFLRASWLAAAIRHVDRVLPKTTTGPVVPALLPESPAEDDAEPPAPLGLLAPNPEENPSAEALDPVPVRPEEKVVAEERLDA
ncbi:hypothetical protein [Polyangium jinanense]|uniref:Uncharacterized protein n=1 Tax=Polyangium jinanense TaxID=2829994 RepID=A0A9X3X323_9BACT|nr:hypothetical protein [Polyangium jinanense]MDC3958343.1 hypothetical protein [Polyangium jinanense]MDC3983322.1 hypothetical protein [Polyangium jinanense]